MFENFEIESRRVEFGIPVDMPNEAKEINDAIVDKSGNTIFVLDCDFDLGTKSSHVSVREGLPF